MGSGEVLTHEGLSIPDLIQRGELSPLLKGRPSLDKVQERVRDP